MNALKTSALTALLIALPLAASANDQSGDIYSQLAARQAAEHPQHATANKGMQGPMRAEAGKARPGEPTLQEQVWNLAQGK